MKNGDTVSVSVLDRLLDPLSRCLTPESARTLEGVRADAVAQGRTAELGATGHQGQLTPEGPGGGHPGARFDGSCRANRQWGILKVVVGQARGLRRPLRPPARAKRGFWRTRAGLESCPTVSAVFILTATPRPGSDTG